MTTHKVDLEFYGVAPEVVRRIAAEFAEAQSGVVYTRIGTCNNAHGTLANWACDLLNLMGGRLGAIGVFLQPDLPLEDQLALTKLDHLLCDPELESFYSPLGFRPLGGMALRRYEWQAGRPAENDR